MEKQKVHESSGYKILEHLLTIAQAIKTNMA